MSSLNRIILKRVTKTDDIMVSWSVLFLPTRVCVVFISVIVSHPSFVHGESIRAHEKWLTAVMSVSPPSAYHTSSSTRNTNSPFIPLQCFPSASYTFLPSHFHGTNPSFPVEAGLILVNRPQDLICRGGRCGCRIAAGPVGGSIQIQNTLIILLHTFLPLMLNT